MAMKRSPFTPTRLQEERDQDKAEVITLKLNRQERAELEQDKETCDIDQDGTMIKELVRLGRQVLRDQIGADFIKYLVSRRRTRYTGRKKLKIINSDTQSNTENEA